VGSNDSLRSAIPIGRDWPVKRFTRELCSTIKLCACFKLLAGSPGGRIPMIAPISPGRLTKLALECAIEGRFGFVSYVGGDVRGTSRCLFERSCGNLKSPTRQVRHRRLRKISSETLHQSGPRNSHFVREIRDRPWVRKAAVEQSEAFPHNRIARFPRASPFAAPTIRSSSGVECR
jgi:hypothetical protein